MLRAAILVVVLLTAGLARADGPGNLDFEQDDPGKPPAGWFVPGPVSAAGWAATVRKGIANREGQCVSLSKASNKGGEGGAAQTHLSTHHGIGILPTIPVQRTVEGIAAGRDEFLEAALEHVEKNKETK